MNIYCTGCEKDVEARLTDGKERYPHRPDLAKLPFWHCDTCGAWVGTHWKTSKPKTPMGTLATPEMLEARKAIHALIDPIWKSGDVPRAKLYAFITRKTGKQYHTGELRTMDEAREVWKIAAELNNQWKFDTEINLRIV